MNRRTGIAATMIAAVAVVPCATTSAAAVASVAGQVSKAELQMDGSVKAQLTLTCPSQSRFEAQVAISQEFVSNGSYVAAIAYSPTITGTCSGKSMRFAVRTTPSDRAAFQRDFGNERPANATRPTLGSVLLTVASADGSSSQYYNFDNSITLR